MGRGRTGTRVAKIGRVGRSGQRFATRCGWLRVESPCSCICWRGSHCGVLKILPCGPAATLISVSVDHFAAARGCYRRNITLTCGFSTQFRTVRV